MNISPIRKAPTKPNGSHESKLLVAQNVSKVFLAADGTPVIAVQGLDLNVEQGEFLCIVGPSGCGKSTLLSMIAGLENPSEGDIRLTGERVTSPRREISMVFQEHAIF